MPNPTKPLKGEQRQAAQARGATKLLQRLTAKLKEQAKTQGGFYFAPTPAAVDGAAKGKVGSIALSNAIEGNPLLKLEGGNPEASSSGPTQGFSIRLPESFEREASANRVRVEVLARSTAAEPTRVGIAYSTNEVGNSRWRWRDVKPTWGVHRLVWKVPQMKEGRGDFIGLMPDKPGAPGVEIHSVSATVVKERPKVAQTAAPHGEAEARSPR